VKQVTIIIVLIALLLGCTCTSPKPVSLSASSPAASARFYLTPADCYTDNSQGYWRLLILKDQDFCSLELPKAPWFNNLPSSLTISCPQFSAWAMLSDYSRETWDMNLITKGDSLTVDLDATYRSDEDSTYLTIWPVERLGACTVWVDYPCPENYIYAKVEPIGCDQIGKDEPFLITFYGQNLNTVGDVYIYWGIWADDGGYGGFYADAHPDFPIGIYDAGERRQGLEDRGDYTEDSVYGQLGVDTAQYQDSMRTLLNVDLVNLRAGVRSKAAWYDFLREQEHDSEYPAAIYQSGVATWRSDPVPFHGHSGPLFNTVMTIGRAGTYVLYFNYAPAQTTHFIRSGHEVPTPTAPPLLFTIHSTPG